VVLQLGERNKLNNHFDELTKTMAQSLTRRAALRKFGIGLAGMALAGSGLANKALATPRTGYCVTLGTSFEGRSFIYTGICVETTTCRSGTSLQCTGKPKRKSIVANLCDSSHITGIDTSNPCSF
jgi:hypothetical protein